LGEKAALAEIKQAHRRLVKEWHPDRRSKKEQGLSHEKMKEINRAYKIVLKYIEQYSYDLTGRRDKEEDPQARWQAQFGNDLTRA
jgi:DnaJ-class molecular chaperone